MWSKNMIPENGQNKAGPLKKFDPTNPLVNVQSLILVVAHVLCPLY